MHGKPPQRLILAVTPHASSMVLPLGLVVTSSSTASIHRRDNVEKKAANHPRLSDATEDAYLKTSTMNVPCITASLPITFIE
jgi:hypothetical protein